MEKIQLKDVIDAMQELVNDKEIWNGDKKVANIEVGINYVPDYVPEEEPAIILPDGVKNDGASE